ncbi:uncharacterized protein TNCV_1073661 [Trichonephila clavipes]|uniref:Uncharacterized protein n=1 Tax=Trichonephila clavipes TaxID=2585209 RepID=A0A8X6T0E4_TRICX|nr:uncharacterized protein TNCV_1073661 [Trichonephila clavipes]
MDKFQQLTEFERGKIIGFREGRFSYCEIGARVQRNSSPVMRVWKQWTDDHRTTQKTSSGQRKATKLKFNLLVAKSGICHQVWNLSPSVEFVTKCGICHQVWNLSPNLEFVTKSGICHQIWNLSPSVESVTKSRICHQVWNLSPNLELVAR